MINQRFTSPLEHGWFYHPWTAVSQRHPLPTAIDMVWSFHNVRTLARYLCVNLGRIASTIDLPISHLIFLVHSRNFRWVWDLLGPLLECHRSIVIELVPLAWQVEYAGFEPVSPFFRLATRLFCCRLNFVLYQRREAYNLYRTLWSSDYFYFLILFFTF